MNTFLTWILYADNMIAVGAAVSLIALIWFVLWLFDDVKVVGTSDYDSAQDWGVSPQHVDCRCTVEAVMDERVAGLGTTKIAYKNCPLHKDFYSDNTRFTGEDIAGLLNPDGKPRIIPKVGDLWFQPSTGYTRIYQIPHKDAPGVWSFAPETKPERFPANPVKGAECRIEGTDYYFNGEKWLEEITGLPVMAEIWNKYKPLDPRVEETVEKILAMNTPKSRGATVAEMQSPHYTTNIINTLKSSKELADEINVHKSEQLKPHEAKDHNGKAFPVPHWAPWWHHTNVLCFLQSLLIASYNGWVWLFEEITQHNARKETIAKLEKELRGYQDRQLAQIKTIADIATESVQWHKRYDDATRRNVQQHRKINGLETQLLGAKDGRNYWENEYGKLADQFADITFKMAGLREGLENQKETIKGLCDDFAETKKEQRRLTRLCRNHGISTRKSKRGGK